MLIVKSPVRISLFGGGTDIPQYFKSNGGMVISSTIDKYFYLGIDGDIKTSGYKLPEDCIGVNQKEIIDDIRKRYMKTILEQSDIPACEISIECTVPIGSGLGTSSSIAAGIIYGLHLLKGKNIEGKELAEHAIRLERTIMKERGGWQDQVAVAYGGMNKIVFGNDGFQVEPVDLASERIQELQSNLMLFDTKENRISSAIHKDIYKNLDISKLNHIRDITQRAWDILNGGDDLDQIGKLLDESWAEKRMLGALVSTTEIDSIYEVAKSAGALGGKILGAGGGGHLLLYVPKPVQEQVKSRLSSLKYVPFQFVNTGPKVIFNNRNNSK